MTIKNKNKKTKKYYKKSEQKFSTNNVFHQEKKYLPSVPEKNNLTVADPISIYLAEIKKYPLLSKEEEHNLAIKYFEKNDTKAAEILVTSNLRFVVKIAAEYSKFGAKLIDLIQEGNVGLMQAVREFNPYKGARLITYAVWWIRGYIQEYLMKQYSMVKIGTTQNQKKLFYKLQKEIEKLGPLENQQDILLLSHKLGTSPQEIKDMSERLSSRDVSLNNKIDEESKSTLLDLQSDKNDISIEEKIAKEQELNILRENINNIRPLLNEKEQFIFENRILADVPMKLQEIGDVYGITREAIRQVENRILKKIREIFLNSLNTNNTKDITS